MKNSLPGFGFSGMRRWWFVSICSLLAIGGLLFWLARASHTSAAAQGADGSVKLSQGAQRQIKALLDEKASRTPAQRKLDSQLLYAAKMRRGEQIASGVGRLNVKMEVDAEAKTIVDITAIVGGTLIEEIEARGAEVISVYARYNSIRARVPIGRLEEIAALPQVRFIQPKQEAQYLRHVERERANGNDIGEELPPGFPARAGRVRGFLTGALDRLLSRGEKTTEPLITSIALGGSKSSEGDATHRAAAARTMFGANGAGVRIGVISDGTVSLAASQASGDLPSNLVVLPGLTGAGDEGTAMLEIINDLAPGAQLYFATAEGGIARFAQAIRDLRAAGCDIIVDDIIYTQETPFQDGQAPSLVSTTNAGVVWQAVNDVVASGALYFSSAGNEGNKNDNTSGTWQGDFADGGSLALAPGGTVHDFGGGTQFDTITASGAFASLFWADPLGGSNNDYDLFVLNSAGTAVVASSTNIQNGTQDPLEAVGSATANNRLVILKKTGAASRFLYLENFRGRLSASTEGNMRGHACAAGAFSVAATPAANAFGALPNPTGPFPNPFTASNTVELFSSDGPRRIFFSANGTAITPGNFSATGGSLRQKPDITAADGVAVTGAGGFPARFFGTSAASPHAGAIAALLKSANPSLTPAQVRTALTSTAIDIEGAGVDRDSGAGIVMAFEALQSIGAVASANLQTGTVAATETAGNGNTFIEPGESASLSVQLLNTGPVGSTGVSAMLTTTTPGVVITTAASAYANLPATTGAGINATPFAFNLSAAAACPLRIDFTLTVAFSGAGSPKVLPFTVQAGLPPLTITSTLDATAPNSGAGFTAMTGSQNLRLTRDGLFSVCGGQKTCPGTTGTGTRRYDAYSFLNCSTTPSCVTVNFGTSCSTTATALFAAAYLGNFDPNNVCTNYLADLGVSPGTLPGNFSFIVPAGMAFTVVVSEVNADGGANCNYTLNLSGLCCQSAGLCPTVSQIAPATSFPGNNIMLAGANLSGVTAVKFAGGATAAFNVVSNSALNVRVRNGAVSGPLTLSRPGCPDLQTPAFTLASNLSSNNEIAVDDGSMEFILTLPPSGTSYFVNRLTPTSYPATVTKLAIFFPSASGAPSSNTPFDLLVGVNPGGGANIDGTKFTATPATTQPGGVFTIYNVPHQTITSGDFVVGFRIPFVSGVFPAALDTSSPSKGRSYTSTDGSTFTVGNFNFGFRVATLQGCPNVTAVSPAGGAAGTQVTLTGTSLNEVTALKFFNNVTAQFTVVSPTQITTTVPNAAVTGPIALTKPGCPDMTAPVFFVGACPTASSVSPASGAVGKQVTINGTGFIGATAVRFANNVAAAFTVNNDTQITATVPNGAVTGPITISRTGCADAQTAAFTVIVCSTINIAPASLPDGTGGVAYSQTPTASGGTAPYSFAVTAGSLPGGLTLASGGAISGMPNVAGTFNFTITATDANGCIGARSYTINIAAPPLGTQNRLLYVLNDNTAGNQIYGYAANETTGALTLLAGFPFATGGNGSDAATSEMLTIDRANQRLYVINRGAGTVGAYSINATTGALGALPFSPINIGSGNWTTIAVHPNGSPLFIGAASNPSRILSFSITATTATAAAGSPFNTGTAQPFSAAFSQDGNFVYTGGNAGATFAGFSVNAANGVLTALAGSPFNSIGSFPAAYATDASGRLFVGNDAQVRVFTTPSGIPTAVAGNPFASGVTETDHGLLHPNGFYLVADRSSNRVAVYKINGTGSTTTLATVAGSPFAAGGTLTQVLALNQGGTILFAANGSTRNLTTFSVNPATGVLTSPSTQPANSIGTSGRLNGMAFLPLIAAPCPTISLSPATLPSGTVGTAYNQTVTASPAGSYTFAVTAGALPAGLTLNSTTGAITGTPTTAATANFTITATGSGDCTGSQAYSITIQPPPCPAITIAPALLSSGTLNTAYNQPFTASGGAVPYNFTLSAGALPNGVMLSASGLLSGTPTQLGSFNITIKATDANGCPGAQSYSLAINCPTVTLSPATLPGGTVGTAYSQTIAASPAGSYTFAITAGSLPAGLSLNSTTGAITGTPTAAGIANFTITATGVGNCTGSQTYSITIQPACPTITNISPTSGVAGATVTITGTNFTGVTGVTFAGNATATFTVNSDTQITTTVPANALSGAIILVKSGCQNAQTPAITIDTPRIVRVVNVSGAPGSPVNVAVELVSQGDENALGFSLTFDPAVLGSPQAALGNDAAGGQINANTLQAAQGRVGVALSLVGGQRFNAGVRQLAVVTFTVAANATAGATPVGFGDQPISREVTSDLATVLPANYTAGAVAITPGYEADVAPRPNGNNNGQVTVSDWVLTGRFAAGLDTPAVGSEFQRADCAPRNTLGDGRISLSDYVQAGRYAAGLDAVVPAGGPTAPVGQLSVGSSQWLRTTGGRRITDTGRPPATRVRLIQDALAVDGSLMIELDATGAENALAFSLRFDPLAWRFISAIAAGDAAKADAARLQINAAEDGRVGILLALPSGQVFAAGAHRIVRVNFAPFPDAQATTGAFSFADEPIQRAVVNVKADAMATEYIITDRAFIARAATIYAGDFSGGELVSGAFVTALGDGLAVRSELADLSALPAELAGTRVTVRDGAGADHAARLLFVSSSQINFQLPPDCAPGFATVTIITGEGAVSLGALWIGAAIETKSANISQPRIAAVLVQGGGTNEIKPLNAGWISDDSESASLLIIGWKLRAANLKVMAGGETLAAAAGDYSGGIEQVQVRLPRGLKGRGEPDVVLVMDGTAANAVRVRIR
ncbi:MAG: putative Ig domain-containing protein [Acidobacteriota bacterium]